MTTLKIRDKGSFLHRKDTMKEETSGVWWLKEEISWEIAKYIKLSKNENTTY